MNIHVIIHIFYSPGPALHITPFVIQHTRCRWGSTPVDPLRSSYYELVRSLGLCLQHSLDILQLPLDEICVNKESQWKNSNKMSLIKNTCNRRFYPIDKTASTIMKRKENVFPALSPIHDCQDNIQWWCALWFLHL